jgi:ATP-dependent helicase/nuclease subunit A
MDSVLERGDQGRSPPGGPVRPGMHRASAATPPVTWWDPAVLRLDVEEQAPLRQQRILEADPDGTAAAASEEDYKQWKRGRDEVLMLASRPTTSVQTVTRLSRTETNAGGVQVEFVARSDPERPIGRRFGALVHALLASVDLNATSEAIRSAAATQGKLVDATEQEINAATVTVVATLKHPVMASVAIEAGSGRVRRETPVLLRREDGTLVEGIVDLAFRQETPAFRGWTVVDFKTDREFESNQSQYATQVALYVEAVEKATNQSARGILLLCKKSTATHVTATANQRRGTHRLHNKIMQTLITSELGVGRDKMVGPTIGIVVSEG